jgi:hypothetical protein
VEVLWQKRRNALILLATVWQKKGVITAARFAKVLVRLPILTAAVDTQPVPASLTPASLKSDQFP